MKEVMVMQEESAKSLATCGDAASVIESVWYRIRLVSLPRQSA